MEPNSLATSDWQQVIAAVNLFWFFMAFLVIAALSFGLAHGIIPSLVTTRQLSAAKARVRPLLYAVSAIAFVFAVVTIYRALTMAYDVLRGIYPRWWI